MSEPAVLMRLDAIIGLLALVVVSLGLVMVLIDETYGVAFFLVVLLLGVVATRSYLSSLLESLRGGETV